MATKTTVQKTHFFRFVEYDHNNKSLTTRTPYYTSYCDILKGCKQVSKLTVHDLYSTQEILLLPLSDTIKKKVQSAQPGTYIKLHKFHRNGDLGLVRITDDELKTNQQINNIDQQIKAVKKKIKKHIPVDLLKKLKQLEKAKKQVNAQQTL